MDGRSHNRRVMPQTASMLACLREAFGEGVQLVYARESGYEVGTAIETTCVGESTAEIHEEAGRRSIGPVAKPATESEQGAEGVAALVRRWPGYTVEELAHAAGIESSALERALIDREAGVGPGEVVRCGQRRDATGAMAARWWPVETAIRHMAERILARGREQVAAYEADYGAWLAQRARWRAVELWRQCR